MKYCLKIHIGEKIYETEAVSATDEEMNEAAEKSISFINFKCKLVDGSYLSIPKGCMNNVHFVYEKQ